MSEINKIHGKYVKWMLKQVPTNNFGMGLVVDHKILKWRSKETCELDPGCEEHLRNWTNRAEVVSENGVEVLDGTVIVRTQHNLLCSGDDIYVPDIIYYIFRREMSTWESVHIYSSEESKNAVIGVFC